METISQFGILLLCGLIEEINGIYACPPSVYGFYKDDNTAYIKPLSQFAGFEPASKDIWEKRTYEYDAYRHFRLRLSHHAVNSTTNSQKTFEASKVLLVVDFDEPVPEQDMFDNVEKLPIKPTIVHRTYKGWHWIFIGNEKVNYDKLMKASTYIHTKIKDSIEFPYEIPNPAMATDRVVNEKLKAYYTGNFVELPDNFEVEVSEEHYISLNEIKLYNVDVAYQACNLLRKLDTTFHMHSWHEWNKMAYYYALRFVLGDENARDTFIEKSLTYPNARLNDIEKTFDYWHNWILKQAENREGFLGGCKFLQANVDTSACKDCPIANKHPFIHALRLEWNLPEGYYVDDDFIYTTVIKGEELQKVKVCSAFIPLRLIKYGDKVVLYVKAGEYKTWEMRFSTTGKLNLATFTELISFDSPKLFHDLLFKIRNWLIANKLFTELDFLGVNVSFVDDRFINKFNIANDNVPIDLALQLLYGAPKFVDFMPAKLGAYKHVADIYRQVFEEALATVDWQTLFLAGHLLTMFNYEYINVVYGVEPRPVVFFRGETGAGKTVRLKFLLSMFGYPKPFSWSNTTDAFMRAKYSFYRSPIIVDEMITDKVERLRDLVYFFANMEAKKDMQKVVSPVIAPVVLAGETRNFTIEGLKETGLVRRYIPLKLKLGSKLTKTIVKLIPQISKHVGFIYDYIDEFQNTKEIDRAMKKYQLNFHDNYIVVENYSKLVIYNAWKLLRILGIDVPFDTFPAHFKELTKLFFDYETQDTASLSDATQTFLDANEEEDKEQAKLNIIQTLVEMCEVYIDARDKTKVQTIHAIAQNLNLDLDETAKEIASFMLCGWIGRQRTHIRKNNIITIGEKIVPPALKDEAIRLSQIAYAIKQVKTSERRETLYSLWRVAFEFYLDYLKGTTINKAPLLAPLKTIAKELGYENKISYLFADLEQKEDAVSGFGDF